MVSESLMSHEDAVSYMPHVHTALPWTCATHHNSGCRVRGQLVRTWRSRYATCTRGRSVWRPEHRSTRPRNHYIVRLSVVANPSHEVPPVHTRVLVMSSLELWTSRLLVPSVENSDVHRRSIHMGRKRLDSISCALASAISERETVPSGVREVI